MTPLRNLLAIAMLLVLCAVGAGWYLAGPVPGDHVEMLRQRAEYERLAKQSPYQKR